MKHLRGSNIFELYNNCDKNSCITQGYGTYPAGPKIQGPKWTAAPTSHLMSQRLINVFKRARQRGSILSLAAKGSLGQVTNVPSETALSALSYPHIILPVKRIYKTIKYRSRDPKFEHGECATYINL